MERKREGEGEGEGEGGRERAGGASRGCVARAERARPGLRRRLRLCAGCV